MLRLFIAINLPEDIKIPLAERLETIKNKFDKDKADIRFTVSEQWHLTISFLGYQPENVNSLIRRALEAYKNNFKSDWSCKIQFEKIIYGPSPRNQNFLRRGEDRLGDRVRMIWLTTSKETSNFLNTAKEGIEGELVKEGIKWRREFRPFHGHITLARFEMTDIKNLPALNETFIRSFEVKKIDLMKSTLKREGPLYEKLFSV